MLEDDLVERASIDVMVAALKMTGLTCVVIGLVFSPIAPVAGALIESATIRHSASIATTFGFALFLYGCVQLAKAKGQPWFYGLLAFANRFSRRGSSGDSAAQPTEARLHFS